MKRLLAILVAVLMLSGWQHVVTTAPIQVTDAKGNKVNAPGQTEWRPSNAAMINGRYHKLLVDQKRGLLDPALTPAQVMTLAQSQTPLPPPHYVSVLDDGAGTTGAVFVGSWDGKAPCVTVTVGSLYDRTLAFLGWPTVDCKDYAPPPQ